MMLIKWHDQIAPLASSTTTVVMGAPQHIRMEGLGLWAVTKEPMTTTRGREAHPPTVSSNKAITSGMGRICIPVHRHIERRVVQDTATITEATGPTHTAMSVPALARTFTDPPGIHPTMMNPFADLTHITTILPNTVAIHMVSCTMNR